jgi:hypothetical protein
VVDAALRVNACSLLFVVGVGRVELETRFGA